MSMNAIEVLQKVERSIEMGTPTELMRAACFSIVIDDFEGVNRAVVERLHELSRAWWARYDALTDEQLAEFDRDTVRYYRSCYQPPTPEPEHRYPDAPCEPERSMTRLDAPPISELEAAWIVRCMENDDHVREFGHYAALIGPDGALPIEPLLAVEKLCVYGHAVSSAYRARSISRAWGSRRKRWEYELIEDALLAGAVRSGQVTGRERNRIVWRLVPYLPGLTGKAIHTQAKRIESDLLRRGVFERVSRQCVRLTEDGTSRVHHRLVPAWLPFAVEEG